MRKVITKIGNSQGVIFDAALLELAHVKVGDEVNLEVHDGGTITITPIRPGPSREEVARTIDGVMTDYAATMKKLA